MGTCCWCNLPASKEARLRSVLCPLPCLLHMPARARQRQPRQNVGEQGVCCVCARTHTHLPRAHVPRAGPGQQRGKQHLLRRGGGASGRLVGGCSLAVRPCVRVVRVRFALPPPPEHPALPAPHPAHYSPDAIGTWAERANSRPAPSSRHFPPGPWRCENCEHRTEHRTWNQFVAFVTGW